jgi:hypothetical protein
MKTSKLKKKNVQRKLFNILYDKIIKMLSKSHETFPLKLHKIEIPLHALGQHNPTLIDSTVLVASANSRIQYILYRYYSAAQFTRSSTSRYCRSDQKGDSATSYSTHTCSTLLSFNCEHGIFIYNFCFS